MEPADTFRKVSLTPPEESVSTRQTFIASIQGCGAATTELSLIHQQASRSSSLRLLLNHVPYQLVHRPAFLLSQAPLPDGGVPALHIRQP